MKNEIIAAIDNEYNVLVNKYLEIFCAKQEIEFEYWVSDEIGGVAHFTSGNYFTFDDIRVDVSNEIKKGVIMEWQDHIIEHHNTGQTLNYRSYTRGLRIVKNGKDWIVWSDFTNH